MPEAGAIYRYLQGARCAVQVIEDKQLAIIAARIS
jgi:hypothetical protein